MNTPRDDTPESLRILHVIQTLDPRFGGPVSVVAGLSSQQVRDGHAVTIVATSCGYPSSSRLAAGALLDLGLDAAVQVLTFEVQETAWQYSWSMYRWLRRHCRDFDMVHIHCLYRAPTTLAARAARRAGVPYLIAPHGALNPALFAQSAVGLRMKRLYERWIEWPNLRRAASIHFTTVEERDNAAFLSLGVPTLVAPNGLDSKRFFPAASDRALRDRLGIADEPLLLFLGRMNFIKGLDLLIPAFAEVVRRLPSARLALVGPDNDGFGLQVDRWIAEHSLQSRVSRMDRVDPGTAARFYRDADACVLPSYSENFGMSAVEALACGTPVVITDQVNIHRAVAEANAGHVVPCDASALADAIVALLRDRSAARRMGEAGCRLVAESWSWASVSAGLSAEYRALNRLGRA